MPAYLYVAIGGALRTLRDDDRNMSGRHFMGEIFDSIRSRLSQGGTNVRSLFAIQLAICISAVGAAHAAGMTVTDAWTPPNPNPGSDAVLGMVLKNDDADADALLRVSCPVANFAEKRQVDIGEGGKSAREVKAIPIPGGSSLTLNKDQFHIALLQITSKLDAGQEFVCALSFRRAGKIQVPVKVRDKAPGS